MSLIYLSDRVFLDTSTYACCQEGEQKILLIEDFFINYQTKTHKTNLLSSQHYLTYSLFFAASLEMFTKTAVFAVWVSACYAFAPMQSNSFRTKSRTNLDANTIISSTSTSLFATVANNTELLSPSFVPSSTRQSSTTVAAVPKMAQRWRKSTKQLATLGPASSTKEMIEKLFLAGADVFRLNFSHGSQEQKKELLIIIRVSIYC